jgi:hypothetical protein
VRLAATALALGIALLSATEGRADPAPGRPAAASPEASATSPAREHPLDDGVYGRLRGDLAISLEFGLAAGEGFGENRTASAAQARLLYLATAGVYGSIFRGAPGDDGRWQGSTGFELRPLFLGRFLKNLEQGPSTADLLLDSLFLGVGARFQPGRSPGFELSTGVEVPLQGRFDGAFLGLRVHHTLTAERLAGAPGRGETLAFLSFGFRLMSTSHLVDVGDQLAR